MTWRMVDGEALRKELELREERLLSDKLYSSFRYLMSDDCKVNKRMVRADLYDIAREKLSQSALYHLNNRLADLEIQEREAKFSQVKERTIKNLESLIGFGALEQTDQYTRELAERNITLLSLNGAKEGLSRYLGFGKDIGRIVRKYCAKADLRRKFSGLEKNELDESTCLESFDMYSLVHDLRVNKKMTYGRIIDEAKKVLTDYLSDNLAFSESLSKAEREAHVKNILGNKKLFSESTARRMVRKEEERIKSYNRRDTKTDLTYDSVMAAFSKNPGPAEYTSRA